MRGMERLVGVCLGLGLAFLATVPATAQDSEVLIHNDSAWDIFQFYLSPVDWEEWGEDQLGDVVLESGGSFTLYAVPCDIYDVLLVDEDGDECVLGGVKICNEEHEWVITTKDLLACEWAS